MAPEIETEPSSNRDRRIQRPPAFQIEDAVRTDLDPGRARVPREECCSERATRPVARTNERDAYQRGLRAAAGHGAPEENSKQQEPHTDEHYLEQREPGKRKRGTLSGGRAARLRTRGCQRPVTSRRLDDRGGLVLILRSRRPTRACYPGKGAEHCDQGNRKSKRKLPSAAPQGSHATPFGRWFKVMWTGHNDVCSLRLRK